MGIVLLESGQKLVLPILQLILRSLGCIQLLPSLPQVFEVTGEQFTRREPMPDMLAKDTEGEATSRALGHVRVLIP